MNGWIRIDQDALNDKPRTEHIGGVRVNVYFSPYDIPEFVRGSFDKEKKRIVFEFQYDAPREETVLNEQSTGRFVRRGTVTGRLYGLELDVEESTETINVNFLISKAKETLRKAVKRGKRSKDRRRPNLTAVKEAFEQSAPDLEKSLSLH